MPFFESHFSYCPLTWMLHSRELNHRIHERCLRVIYYDDRSTFQELLEKDKSYCIHQKNVCSICIELYKIKKGIAPDIIKNVFSENPIDFRKKEDFYSPFVNSV